METLLETLVLLLVLSGSFLVLGAGCAVIEHLEAAALSRGRRGRSRTGRTHKRVLIHRPRRRREPAVELGVESDARRRGQLATGA